MGLSPYKLFQEIWETIIESKIRPITIKPTENPFLAFFKSEFAFLISSRHIRAAQRNEITLIGGRPKNEYLIYSQFFAR